MVGLGLASHRFLIIVAAGYLASIVAYPYLPGPAPGVARPLIAFLLPTTAASIYGLLRRVWDRDLVRDRDETFESSLRGDRFCRRPVRHCHSPDGSGCADRCPASAASVAGARHDCACRGVDGQSWQSTSTNDDRISRSASARRERSPIGVCGCRRIERLVTSLFFSVRCSSCREHSCPNRPSNR